MQVGDISDGSAENTDKVPETPYHPEPGADSLLGGTLEQRQTFCMLSDKAHTCQKEQ